MESKTCNVCLKRPNLNDHCKSLGDMLKEMLKSYDDSKLRQLEELSYRSGYSLHGVFCHASVTLFSF